MYICIHVRKKVYIYIYLHVCDPSVEAQLQDIDTYIYLSIYLSIYLDLDLYISCFAHLHLCDPSVEAQLDRRDRDRVQVVNVVQHLKGETDWG